MLRASSSAEQKVYDLAGMRGEMTVVGMVASSVAHSAYRWAYAMGDELAESLV